MSQHPKFDYKLFNAKNDRNNDNSDRNNKKKFGQQSKINNSTTAKNENGNRSDHDNNQTNYFQPY